ncbi:hypothetical protein BOTNAR_0243g00060 [Botryotinia narcissicola]|uniref:Uncharacterized protein n=1 Tax=Botryotinia narcissicola TaxID=278944 RepID=A0A4Z1I2D7_9HELO|nr:hypothetical protein BOTNAR_0243g00060 [Botryotinia narcissicola]
MYTASLLGRDDFQREPSGPQFYTLCKASHIEIITNAISSCQFLAPFLVAHIFRARWLRERGDQAAVSEAISIASSGSIHSITTKDAALISNDDKRNNQQQSITNIELSRSYVVNSIYLPENIGNGVNKPSNMYHEGQAQNKTGLDTIYTSPQENSFHYIRCSLPDTRNHQADGHDDKLDQFTEFYFPKSPNAPLMFEIKGCRESKT